MRGKKRGDVILKALSVALFLRVQNWKLHSICVCFLLAANLLHAQTELGGSRRGSRIIDDSTKQIYGPTTSKYFYEEDVFFNQQVLYPIDTVIRNFHRFTYVQRNDNLLQDLGNIGTASRPVYYTSPAQIGSRIGISTFDPYWFGDRMRYFDTKSSYSNMKLSLGGKGRSLTHVTYSRNINPRWNFGFDYRSTFVDKQVQRRGKGDRNVRSTYYDFFTTFQSKDSTYRLFFNAARGRHQVYEYGGILVGDDYTFSDFFGQNIRPSLTSAENRELRINWHLFHQYEIGKALQVYHTFDRSRQGNQFFNEPGREANYEFDFVEVDSTKTHDEVKFISLRNEAGIKGNILKLFYNGYYAIRNYSMSYKYIDEDTLAFSTKGAEHYIGGRASLKLDSIFTLFGWMEVQDNGNFRIEGRLQSKWLEASLIQKKYSPGFVQQAYRGSHDVWNNNFSSIDVSQLNGFIHYRSSFLKLSPGLTFTRLHNYVFFKQDSEAEGQQVLPVQSSGDQIFTSPEVRLSVRILPRLTFQARGIYTTIIENADEAIQVPDLFVNGQLAYENIFFNGNFDIHVGLDVHWRSAYYAYGYDPVIQQFYQQREFESPEFPIVDVFLNAKIKRGRIFVKYHNLVQAFTKEGYFPTPFYPGQQNIVDFGFDWSFYD